jgi:hypothetical protein
MNGSPMNGPPMKGSPRKGPDPNGATGRMGLPPKGWLTMIGERNPNPATKTPWTCWSLMMLV